MGLLLGCAMVPMALVMFAISVFFFVQEPLSLVLLVLIGSAVRSLWRAHRAHVRRREQRL